jgi:hypothetical protein
MNAMSRLLLCLLRAPVLLGLSVALAPALVGGAAYLLFGSDWLISAKTPETTEPTTLAEVKDSGGSLPQSDELVELARKNPVGFLEKVIIRYDREMKTHQGYTCLLVKRERVKGKLPPPEKTEEMAVRFREQPFSVLLEWKKNPGKAQRVLYVKGENNDKLLVLPKGIGSFRLWERDPLGEEALESGRYPLTEFGIQVGSRRALASWQADPHLKVEYLGEKKVPQLGDRLCYVLRRTGYRSEVPGGVEVESTFYFDKETWLQVGSVLMTENDQLLAEYWFRDFQYVDKFDANAFTRQAVKGE